MPELPEVETIVRQLKKKILNQTLAKVEIVDPQVVDPRLKNIAPVKIKDIYRQAKYIILELEKEQFILVHLRLTGYFHYLSKTDQKKNSKHKDHSEEYLTARFYFSDGSLLTYHDIRRFSLVKLMNRKQIEKELSGLGPGPLDPQFTLNQFQESLIKKSRANLKVALLDQSFISGIGNIYAQEILYHAGISPLRQVGSLSPLEIKKLYEEMKRVLKLAIEHQGATVQDYIHLESRGGFQKYLTVYQRERCPKRHLLIKKAMGGRGTSYCPQCQK